MDETGGYMIHYSDMGQQPGVKAEPKTSRVVKPGETRFKI